MSLIDIIAGGLDATGDAIDTATGGAMTNTPNRFGQILQTVGRNVANNAAGAYAMGRGDYVGGAALIQRQQAMQAAQARQQQLMAQKDQLAQALQGLDPRDPGQLIQAYNTMLEAGAPELAMQLMKNFGTPEKTTEKSLKEVTEVSEDGTMQRTVLVNPVTGEIVKVIGGMRPVFKPEAAGGSGAGGSEVSWSELTGKQKGAILDDVSSFHKDYIRPLNTAADDLRNSVSLLSSPDPAQQHAGIVMFIKGLDGSTVRDSEIEAVISSTGLRNMTVDRYMRAVGEGQINVVEQLLRGVATVQKNLDAVRRREMGRAQRYANARGMDDESYRSLVVVPEGDPDPIGYVPLETYTPEIEPSGQQSQDIDTQAEVDKFDAMFPPVAR